MASNLVTFLYLPGNTLGWVFRFIVYLFRLRTLDQRIRRLVLR